MTPRKPAAREEPTTRSVRAASFAVALDDLASDPIARRDFLLRMGAAIALSGLGGCTRAPSEEIIPYVVQPPEVRPGHPRIYATASVLDGYATGVLVESHTGRPTKVEGNPEHPASLGATGAFEQASVLSLYDPARARAIRQRGEIVTWPVVSDALRAGPWVNDGGRGLHVHLEPTSSPTVIGLVEELRRRFPRAGVTFGRARAASAWEGARIAFGRVLEPRLELARADVIVALDSDLLATGPSALRDARAFADRRAGGVGSGEMNRLYVVEPLVTVTGMKADHRLRVRARDVLSIAVSLAAAIGMRQLPGEARAVPEGLAPPGDAERRFVEAVARDLTQHRGRSVVVAGEGQPPEVHALVHAINAELGNAGVTVRYAESPIFEAGAHGADDLAGALVAGAVDTLLVCGGNPIYAAPNGADLARLVGRVRQSAYLCEHDDESSTAFTYAVARSHPLESWGDARAFDGTVSIVQPLIEPMYEGYTEIDLLALFAGVTGRPYELVRRRFATDGRGLTGEALERAWRATLRKGVVDGTATALVDASLDWAAVGKVLARAASTHEVLRNVGELELVSRLDPHVHDGRFANNAWLLELPSPVSKLTWSNAATLSAATARRLGVVNGDEVALTSADGAVTVKAPACVVPGQVDGSVGLTLGWGRTRGAPLSHGRGASASPLARTTSVTVAKTGAHTDLSITQTERRLMGRDEEILHHRSLAELRARPAPKEKKHLSLYSHAVGDKAPFQWAMAIDLTRCTGCAACVIACQAENNVPTVGPGNVFMSREMHWLRIDSYLVGSEDDPKVAVQPMLCQHCEAAPCEYVCPVNATVHSPDGLNEMVYNRCVGTRFCSNNCPYKVRRFNWFEFHQDETATEQLVHNPDVTVRQRGVMEKCTFCVQRIREWEIDTHQGRPAKAPRTACQQVCPTQAIVFGDLHAPGSEVKRLHDDARAFGALEELGTEPRVRYLARIDNPNPELP